MKLKRVLKYALIPLVLSLLVPYSTENIPEWSIKVVDLKGNVVPGVVVRQEWHYVNFIPVNEEELTTDKDGGVAFPARKFTCPLICRAPVFLLNRVFVIAHVARTYNGGASVVEQETFRFLLYTNGVDKAVKHTLVLHR